MKTYSIRILRIISAVLAGALVTGCASTTQGTKKKLEVNSTPPGAIVKLDNGMTGITPASFRLKAKNPVKGTIEKPGYETVSINAVPHMTSAATGPIIGNTVMTVFSPLLLGGPAWIIDISNGSLKQFDRIDVVLNPLPAPPPPLAATQAPARQKAPAPRVQKQRRPEHVQSPLPRVEEEHRHNHDTEVIIEFIYDDDGSEHRCQDWSRPVLPPKRYRRP